MTCPSCGNETKGIKLNGKLFCSFCGVVIKDTAEILEESYEHLDTPNNSPRADTKLPGPATVASNNLTQIPAEQEIIPPNLGEEPLPTAHDASILEAEKEVIEIIEEMADEQPAIKIQDGIIKKHERTRTDLKQESLPKKPNPLTEPESLQNESIADAQNKENKEIVDNYEDPKSPNEFPNFETDIKYNLAVGEPDPITEPELESPHDDLIEDEQDEQIEEVKDNFEAHEIAKEIPPSEPDLGYELVDGEPDPIKEPELEAPHDDLITDNQEKDIDIQPKNPGNAFSRPLTAATTDNELPIEAPKPITEPERETLENELFEKVSGEDFDIEPNKQKAPDSPPASDQKKNLEDKKKRNRELLSSYLKLTSGVGQDNQSNKKGKKSKKKKKRVNNKTPIKLGKWFWVGAGIAFFVVAIGALVIYVHSTAINEAKIQTDIEKNVDFVFEKPAAALPGYRLSYLSESGGNFINYYYTFAKDKKRYLSIKIEPTDLKPQEIGDKLITKEGTSFSQTELSGLQFWQTDDNQIYVIKDDLLYSFMHSGEVLDGVLLDYAQEMLL